MPNTLLLSRLKHGALQINRYDHAKRDFQTYLCHLDPKSHVACRAAYALDQQVGDFDLRFSHAESKLFQIFSEAYSAQNTRRPRMLGSIIHESRPQVSELYCKVLNHALLVGLSGNYANIFCKDFLTSKEVEGGLYREIMAAMDAEQEKLRRANNAHSRSGDQVKDVIKEHFWEKGLPLFDVQAQMIKDKANALLTLAFRNYCLERHRVRKLHTERFIGPMQAVSGRTKPDELPNKKTVRLNPMVKIHMYWESETFSAQAFMRRQMVQRGHSCIFGNQMERHPSAPERPQLQRQRTYPE